MEAAAYSFLLKRPAECLCRSFLASLFAQPYESDGLSSGGICWRALLVGYVDGKEWVWYIHDNTFHSGKHSDVQQTLQRKGESADMSKRLMRSILLIITYTVLLVLALMRSDWIFGLLGQVLAGCQPLFLGFAIAFILNQPCTFFCRHYERNLGKRWKKLGRPLAVLTSYLMLIAVIVALFSFVIPRVVDSVQTLAISVGGYLANLQALLNQVADYLDWEALNLDLTSLTQNLRSMLNGVLNGVSNAAAHLMTVTGSIISMFVTLVLAVVFSVYMLAGKEKLLRHGRQLLRAYLPRRWADTVSAVIQLTAETFSNFVSGQLIEACILGSLCALGMFFIQADYAALVGVIVGVSALIPVAGAYIGALLSAFLLVMVDPVRALVFLIFLAVLQQIEGNVIYPRVVGTSIGLPGIWVLAAVTVGGGLFDLLGVLLSVPIASVLYTLLKHDIRRRLRRRLEQGEVSKESLEKNAAPEESSKETN